MVGLPLNTIEQIVIDAGALGGDVGAGAGGHLAEAAISTRARFSSLVTPAQASVIAGRAAR